jgi:hypothetical protein
MIKPISQMMGEHLSLDLIHGRQIAAIRAMMEQYAEEIIDECRTTFQWEWDCEDEHDALMIVDQDTINDVKQQIR